MRRLRTMPARRIYALLGVILVVALSAGIAQGALTGSDPTPAPRALDQAILDALKAQEVPGVTAKIRFDNNLLPAGSLPEGHASPLAAGAEGRLWATNDGRVRLELQSDAGDAQVVSDGKRVTVYDASTNTTYTGAIPDEKQGYKAHSHPEPTLARVQKGLARVAKFWNLSGAEPTSTAGRPTYTVRISPKDDGGLLGAGELAFDADKGLPLRAAVYAQDQADPVLSLIATDVSYAPVALSDVDVSPPAGAEVVDVNPGDHAGQGRPDKVQGVGPVQQRLDFPLAAPDELAGLPRKDVHLVQSKKKEGAVSVYGEGLGAIVVMQHKAGEAKKAARSERDLQLPQVNVDGASGTELATALGTVIEFEHDGISYTVAGSVTPAAAEEAARGLK